jgi:hypothetical protein
MAKRFTFAPEQWLLPIPEACKASEVLRSPLRLVFLRHVSCNL